MLTLIQSNNIKIMPNPIIQNYLNDEAISVAGRDKIIAALDAGQSEEDISSLISKKHGSKYGSTANNEAALSGGLPSMLSAPSTAGLTPGVTKTGAQINQENSNPLTQLGNAYRKNIADPIADALDSPALQPYAEGLKPLAAIADNPISKEIARAGASSVMGFGEGVLNQASALSGAINPLPAFLGKMKEFMPDKAGEIDNMINTPDIFKQLSGALSGAVDKVSTEATGISKDSVSGNLGGILGKVGSIIPGIVAGKQVSGAVGSMIPESLAGTQAVVGAEEGRIATPWEFGAGLLGDKLVGGALNKIFKAKMPPSLPVGSTADDVARAVATQKDEAVKYAMNQGLSESDANLVTQLTPNQDKLLVDLLDAGAKKQASRTAPDVFEVAAKEVDDFMKTAKKEISTVGKDLSKRKTELADLAIPKEQIDLAPVFQKYNVKVTPDGLNFGNSEIKGSQAAKIIEDLYSDMNNPSSFDFVVRDLEGKTGQIDTATKFMKTQGGGAPVRAMGDLKTILNNAIGESDDVFKQLNTKYAELIQPYNQVKNAGSVRLDTGKVAFNPKQLIRRSASNVDVKSTEALKELEVLAGKLGVSAPQDLAMRGHLAELAERITGTKAPTSLGGIMESTGDRLTQKAGQEILKKTPVVGEMANAVYEAMKGKKPTIQADIAKVVKLLESKTPKAILVPSQLVKPAEEALVSSLKGLLKDAKKNLISPEVLNQTLKTLVKAGIVKSSGFGK